MKAIIVCEQGLEECEGLIVYDLLKRSGIDVELIGQDEYIESSHKLIFKTNKKLDTISFIDYDCLILPGGMPGTINLENNKKVNELIDYFYKENKYICAICAAPSILIKKGILKDNEFTCFPGFENGLISTNENVHVHNKIITANGLGSSIEFALTIIEKLLNKDEANKIANKIQYKYY